MAKQKKYHYLYKTKCLVTNKFYVGMHSTDNLDDGYLGSGKILRYSIGKHGRENHKLEILEFLPDRVALKQREKEVVNEEMLSHPLNMNLMYGGEGGWDIVNQQSKNLYGKNGQMGYGGSNLVTNRSKSSKTSWQLHRNEYLPTILSAQKIATQRAASNEAKEKRKITYANRGHQKGDKNSQFGSAWITNGENALKVKREELDNFVSMGYRRGRK